jgi:hypothetical protein
MPLRVRHRNELHAQRAQRQDSQVNGTEADHVQQPVQHPAQTRGLRADGVVRHGAGALVQHGRLPAGSEFDYFRDVLDERRREGLAWVGTDASCFDRDDVEAYARWGTAADIVWGVLLAEGMFTNSRRRKSLVEYWEAPR